MSGTVTNVGAKSANTRIWHAASCNQLRKLEPLRSLGTTDLSFLSATCRYRECSAGEVLFWPHERDGNVLLVVRGAMWLHTVTASGNRVMAAVVGAVNSREPGIVPACLAPGCVTQVVVTPTEVYSLPTDGVARVCCRNPTAACCFSVLLAHEMSFLCSLNADLTGLPVIVRLSHTLAHLARFGSNGLIRLSREDLAGMVGASESEVTKRLGDLRDLGLIRYKPHQPRVIVALDAGGLASL